MIRNICIKSVKKEEWFLIIWNNFEIWITVGLARQKPYICASVHQILCKASNYNIIYSLTKNFTLYTFKIARFVYRIKCASEFEGRMPFQRLVMEFPAILESRSHILGVGCTNRVSGYCDCSENSVARSRLAAHSKIDSSRSTPSMESSLSYSNREIYFSCAMFKSTT